jgi:hypothetical protein
VDGFKEFWRKDKAAFGAAEIGAILALMARRKHGFGNLSMSDAELMAAALLGLEHQRSDIEARISALASCTFGGNENNCSHPENSHVKMNTKMKMTLMVWRRVLRRDFIYELKH